MLLFAFVVALSGAAFYGGYRYWQDRPSVSQPPESVTESPNEAYEIIDNPNGSHTFVCYKFDFKFNYPSDWEFSEKYSNLRGATGTDEVGSIRVFDESGKSHIDIFIFLPRDLSKFPTLRDFLVYLDDRSEIPQEANFEVDGIPAFKYHFWGPQVADVIDVIFEHDNHTFEIYIPWEKRDDSEYNKILETFEFLK